MSRRFPPIIFVLCLVLTSSGSTPRAQEARGLSADLVRLIEAQGVSGFETDVRDLIRTALPSWAKPTVDSAGNLLVTIGRGQPNLLITASIDEDGFIVSGITDEGYLRLQRVTTGAAYRLFDQFHYGQPVRIRSAAGALVPGVTGTASTHLLRGAQASTSVRGLEDLWVDVGASSRAEAERAGVQLLDPVALRERAQVLAGGDRVAGVAAQARAGALALAMLLAGAAREPTVTGTVTIAWAAQGVFGDRGFARIAHDLDADRVVVVMRTPAPRDADARGAVGRPGGGPMVTDGDSFLLDRAKQAGFGTQALPALKPPAAFGAKAQMVALPILFAQTPVETVDLRDLAELVVLLRNVAGIPEPGEGAANSGSIFSPASSPASGRPARPEPAMFKTLRPLVEAYGVSGHETPVREVVAKALPAWAKPEVDERGNLTVTFGQGARDLVFVAHLDELGYEITGILDDGSATVRKRGGFFDSLMEAHPVVVHAARGSVGAVTAPRQNYLRASDWQPKPEEVSLCFGTSTRAATEALGVKVGDAVTVRKAFEPLAGTRGTARSLDDRAGCAALLNALAAIDPAKTRSRVTFAWVVGEETGLEGSRFLAERLHPAFAFAVDTFVSSDSPIDSHRFAHLPLGSGAVLRAIDNASITPPDVIAKIRAMAAAQRIRVGVGTTGGGTDASAFTRGGAVVVPLSWPGRYSHSPVEVLDALDLEALARLVTMLALGF